MLPATRGRYALRAGTDTSSEWAAFHWARVAPNPVRAGPDGVLAAAGEDEAAGLGGGEALGPDVVPAAAGEDEAAGLAGGEVLGSAAGFTPLQPVSARTTASALTAVKSFTEG